MADPQKSGYPISKIPYSIFVTPKGRSTKESKEAFMRNHVIPYRKKFGKECFLAIYDSLGLNRKDEFKDELRENRIDRCCVPVGLTGDLQPNDQSGINKKFNDQV